jgi:hypothetical protein
VPTAAELLGRRTVIPKATSFAGPEFRGSREIGVKSFDHFIAKSQFEIYEKYSVELKLDVTKALQFSPFSKRKELFALGKDEEKENFFRWFTLGNEKNNYLLSENDISYECKEIIDLLESQSVESWLDSKSKPMAPTLLGSLKN